jgi:hypothetical protein
MRDSNPSHERLASEMQYGGAQHCETLQVGRRMESSKGEQGDEVHRLLHHLTVDLLRESFYSLKRVPFF